MAEILERLRSSADKGRLLELVFCDALQEHGFVNINRQQSGTQFGFDVVAYRHGEDGSPEVWKFECKNVGDPLTVDQLAPKLIYHMGATTIDVFVIVSLAPLSNALRELLEHHEFSMRIEVWVDAFLESMIASSEKSCCRLGLKASAAHGTPVLPMLFPAKNDRC